MSKYKKHPNIESWMPKTPDTKIPLLLNSLLFDIFPAVAMVPSGLVPIQD